MCERFWKFFTLRSLTCYYQLRNFHHYHHGFMIALKLLGDDLNVKSSNCTDDYIRMFSQCQTDPVKPIDAFICNMKLVRSVYASDFPALYRIDSYLRDVIREISNCHLEKDSYRPRV